MFAALVSAWVGAGVTAGLLGRDRRPTLPALPVAHRAVSATTLTSSLTPSVFGRPVSFTATVTVVAPGHEVPTGTVRFTDGSTPLGTVAVSSGRAVLSTADLHGGAHTVVAAYSGDADVASSTGSVGQRVVPAPTRLVGSPVALAAFQLSAMLTRADTGTPVTGRTVEMSVGGAVLCRGVTGNNGTARCNGIGGALEVLLNKGYTATFTGDSDYGPSSGQGVLI